MGKCQKLLLSMLYVLVFSYAISDRVFMYVMIAGFGFQSGLMGTHDEETRAFFHQSHVHCLLAPRHIDDKLSLFKQQVRTIDIPIILL